MILCRRPVMTESRDIVPRRYQRLGISGDYLLYSRIQYNWTARIVANVCYSQYYWTAIINNCSSIILSLSLIAVNGIDLESRGFFEDDWLNLWPVPCPRRRIVTPQRFARVDHKSCVCVCVCVARASRIQHIYYRVGAVEARCWL